MKVLLARLLRHRTSFLSLWSFRSFPTFALTAFLLTSPNPLTFAEEKSSAPAAPAPTAPAPAQPALTERDWLIHLELTAVLVPEKMALPLIDEFDDETKADAAYTKLLATVEKGDAELAGRQIIHTESDVERTSETIEEMRYPIEFEQPTFPDLQSKKDLRDLPQEELLALFSPTTFEIKNVGLSFTASPTVSTDGQHLTVTATPQHVRFLGWDEFPAGLLPFGQKLTVRQPKFFVASSNGRVVVRSGQRIVFGVHKVPDKPRTWELFLLKAWTTRRPLEAK